MPVCHGYSSLSILYTLCFFFPSTFPELYTFVINECLVSEIFLWVVGCKLLLFSCQVMSDSLWSDGLQHARLPCPSLSPRVCSTHVHWVSDVIQPSHPLLPSTLPAFNLPNITVFSGESALRIRWPKYWSFSFSIRIVIAFLPRSKYVLIYCLQSPSTVILESNNVKSANFPFVPIYLPQSDGTGCHDLSFLNVEF